MGRLLLVARLAARDVKRHPSQALLVLIVIVVATGSLGVGLTLGNITDRPYEQTRAATAGPDVLAEIVTPPAARGRPANLGPLNALSTAPGVVGHGGPYRVIQAPVQAGGRQATALTQGRGTAPAAIDQPYVTDGAWVTGGGVVVERAFATALGVRVGDAITIGGRPLRVAGIAVSASIPPYPSTYDVGWSAESATPGAVTPGFVWVSDADLDGLISPERGVAYFLDLRLADPAQADAFAAAHSPGPGLIDAATPRLSSWQQIRDWDNLTIENVQQASGIGGTLLGLLAITSIVVLVGGRMAEQRRRVGLLKAVGATPLLIAAVLLAEQLVIAVVAAALGLFAARLVAPLLTSAGDGLLGTAGSPEITARMVVIVAAAALGIAAAATLVPALGAARSSTVAALNNAPRAPRRSTRVVNASAGLPVALLFGLRLATRRPRRSILNAVGFLITIAGIVIMLCVSTFYTRVFTSASTLDNPRVDRIHQLIVALAVMVAILAVVNTVFIAWTAVLDSRHSSALIRALGATSGQAALGLCVAQLVPAMIGTVVGIPAGIFAHQALRHGDLVVPFWWMLVAVVLGALVVVNVLAGLSAQASRRVSIVQNLQAAA
ncbi:FtsX-like permease family protein [Dactylosporangium vinaceum]|uniref:FtsX-like permease family protein n=1 Tax=Dactylosporangium vinaceum TaxID=53362 RepID=A0ABV5MT12_9ACTN|nr:FtsX-like permease family protein [Dactylosporangium vinaceum]UAB99905.1 FtsX-like permease family protein [Dactylosporangium vinaceum]